MLIFPCIPFSRGRFTVINKVVDTVMEKSLPCIKKTKTKTRSNGKDKHQNTNAERATEEDLVRQIT